MFAHSQQSGVGEVGEWSARGAARREPVALELEENGTWSFPVCAAGVEVLCLSGTVWLTREGDPEDRFLSAGEAFASRMEGRLALMAFTPARLLVRPPLDGEADPV